MHAFYVFMAELRRLGGLINVTKEKSHIHRLFIRWYFIVSYNLYVRNRP